MSAIPVATSATSATPVVRQHNSTRVSKRATAVQWLRKAHGWIGLWGATLGLLFGCSGIWLNHRAVLKLPPMAQVRANSQLALPEPAPATAEALATWLQSALELPHPATSIRSEPAKPVAWTEKGDKSTPRLMQPAHWMINFGGPKATVQAELWVGNQSVSVRSTDNGLMGTLTSLHKGIGMPVAWILLVDTLAGSLILLSLSGLTLWVLTHRKRVIGLTIFGAAFLTTVGLALSRL